MLCFTSQLNDLEQKLLNAVYEEYSRQETENSRIEHEYSVQFTNKLRNQVLQLLGIGLLHSDLDVSTIVAAVKKAYPLLYLAVGKQVFGEEKVKHIFIYWQGCCHVCLMI